MKKLFIMSVLFIALTGFINTPVASGTYYYVVSAQNYYDDVKGCNQWIISNIVEKTQDCRVTQMMEFVFSDYYLKKYNDKCAIRGIYAKGLNTYAEAEVYRQKLIEENKQKGRETYLTDDFEIPCQ